MKKVQTYLSDEIEKQFLAEVEKSGKSEYTVLRDIIKSHFDPNDDVQDVNQFTASGNFEEDVKSLADSDITTKDLKKALMELDNQRKTKNTIKKGGAFHTKNAIMDIYTLFQGGLPDFFEVKYHIDWWTKVGLISNALARRGISMKIKYDFNDSLIGRFDGNPQLVGRVADKMKENQFRRNKFAKN